MKEINVGHVQHGGSPKIILSSDGLLANHIKIINGTVIQTPVAYIGVVKTDEGEI